MITGIGVDLQDLRALCPAYLDVSDSFCSRTFSLRELEEAGKRPDKTSYYAGRFSAKEAVIKALVPTTERMDLREIEILTGTSGEPLVVLSGLAAKFAEEQHIVRILVSISHSTPFVTSFAIAQTNP